MARLQVTWLWSCTKVWELLIWITNINPCNANIIFLFVGMFMISLYAHALFYYFFLSWDVYPFHWFMQRLIKPCILSCPHNVIFKLPVCTSERIIAKLFWFGVIVAGCSLVWWFVVKWLRVILIDLYIL
jgi:hypothetical protein